MVKTTKRVTKVQLQERLNEAWSKLEQAEAKLADYENMLQGDAEIIEQHGKQVGNLVGMLEEMADRLMTAEALVANVRGALDGPAVGFWFVTETEAYRMDLAVREEELLTWTLHKESDGQMYFLRRPKNRTLDCSCPGFRHRGHCKHVKMLVDLHGTIHPYYGKGVDHGS